MRQDMQIVFQDPYLARSGMTVGGSSPSRSRCTASDAAGAPRPCAACSRWSASTRTTRTATRTSSRGPAPADRRRPRLALNPKLIICDEPVSALDVSIQAQILNLLKDLQRDFGLTYLFISHDLAVVRTMSDEIAVMNQGKLVEVGPAEQVYLSPKDEYTRRCSRPCRFPIRAASASARPSGRGPSSSARPGCRHGELSGLTSAPAIV